MGTTVLPHPAQVLPGTVIITDELSVADVDETSKKSMDSGSAPMVSAFLTATPSLVTPPWVHDLDLSHPSP